MSPSVWSKPTDLLEVRGASANFVIPYQAVGRVETRFSASGLALPRWRKITEGPCAPGLPAVMQPAGRTNVADREGTGDRHQPSVRQRFTRSGEFPRIAVRGRHRRESMFMNSGRGHSSWGRRGIGFTRDAKSPRKQHAVAVASPAANRRREAPQRRLTSSWRWAASSCDHRLIRRTAP